MTTDREPKVRANPASARQSILSECSFCLDKIDEIVMRLKASNVDTWEEVGKCGSLRDQLKNIIKGFRD